MDTAWRRLTMEEIPWRRLPSCCWLLVTYTVLITATAPTLHGLPTPEILLQSGSTLELNCSIPAEEQLQGYNASDLRFRFNDQEWRADQVRLVDERTARLQVPHADRALHTGIWSCALQGQEQPLGMQSVTIADLPVKPNITGCIVYNWDSMTCKWEPKQQDTGIPTNQTLYWTLLIYSRQPPYYHCPILHDNACTWKDVDSGDSFKFRRVYRIFVVARNELATTTTQVAHFDTMQLVKPDPVKQLNVGETGPYHVVLRWTSPVPAAKLILYKVNYRRTGTYTWRELNVTTTHADITGLLPYRAYTIRISCIPGKVGDVAGFWSDAVDTSITTDTSVPTAAPAISPGGFRTSDDQHNTQKRTANIFWKSIPEEERNGLIQKYRVRYRAVHSDTWESEEVRKRTIELSLDKDKAYQVVVDAATLVGYNQSVANSLTPIYIAQRDKVPPQPGKLSVVSVEEGRLVEMNWTAVEGAVSYTVYWCQGSAQFRSCNDEIDWISVDEDSRSYYLNLGGYQPKQFIFGISAESRIVNDTQQGSSHRERRSPVGVVSSGIKWSECTYSSDKPVRGPQKVAFSDHQDPETITLEWTHPKCDESAYIDEYIISYCQVTNCPVSEEDAATTEVVRVPVDNELEEFTLVGLTPLVEYRVWVQSHSPNKGLSAPTDRLQITVRASGLSKGIIAVICIVGIIGGFFIVFGIYQIVKRCCRTVKENTTLKVQLPPDVGSTFSHSNFEETVDAEYMHNYNTLLAGEPQEKDSKDYPRAPNGTQGRGYFTNGLSQSRDITYGVGVNRDSTSSNDTMLTLLQHPSADSFDDVFDSGLGASIGHDQSVSSGLRLTPVPEEAGGGGGDAGWRGTGQNYDRQTSGTSRHSTSTIPGYSRCGVPDNEITDEETAVVTATPQTGVAPSPTGNHPNNNTPQPNDAGLSPKVPSHSAAARAQTPVNASPTSPGHHPLVGVGKPTEEPLVTEGQDTMAEPSRTQITPPGSVSLSKGGGGGGGGSLCETMANPSAGAAAASEEADYSMVNTGGTASPSTCMSGASSPDPTYSPQTVSADSPHLQHGTYNRPHLGSEWARPGEATGAEHRHDPCHMGLLPAVKSAATNNNNGYVTVSM